MEKAVYRIIDANLNRATEAFRLIEEFCRFSLDNATLTAALKSLRHQLCAQIKTVGSEKLISARDTAADIGCDIEIADHIKREDFTDCISAAFRRLTEALRVLGEATAALKANIARNIEKIRYETYTLEKQIMLFAEPKLRFANVRLYVLLQQTKPTELMEAAQSCIKGGADCIQLRSKDIPDAQFLNLAKELVKICSDNNMISIINDRADIAVFEAAHRHRHKGSCGRRDYP